MRESVQCSELQQCVSDTHLYFLLILRLSGVTRVLYQLRRFTEGISMFAQLSVQADLQVLLLPRLLMCLKKEKRAAGVLGDTLGAVLLLSMVLTPVRSERCH